MSDSYREKQMSTLTLYGDDDRRLVGRAMHAAHTYLLDSLASVIEGYESGRIKSHDFQAMLVERLDKRQRILRIAAATDHEIDDSFRMNVICEYLVRAHAKVKGRSRPEPESILRDS